MPRASASRSLLLAFASMLVAGCGSVSLWPFGDEGMREYSRTPADATEYQCDGGKRFHVRMLQGGASAWIILPERQFRLDRADAGGAIRYANGSTSLELNGAEATLRDGALALFSDCRTGAVGAPK